MCLGCALSPPNRHVTGAGHRGRGAKPRQQHWFQRTRGTTAPLRPSPTRQPPHPARYPPRPQDRNVHSGSTCSYMAPIGTFVPADCAQVHGAAGISRRPPPHEVRMGVRRKHEIAGEPTIAKPGGHTHAHSRGHTLALTHSGRGGGGGGRRGGGFKDAPIMSGLLWFLLTGLLLLAVGEEVGGRYKRRCKHTEEEEGGTPA